MKLALADVDKDGLQQTANEVSSIVGASNVLAIPVDVANLDEVVKLKEKVFEAWDEVQSHIYLLSKCQCTDMIVRLQVAVLMNNAGVAAWDGKRGTSWENRNVWTKVFNTNVVGYVTLSPKSSAV